MIHLNNTQKETRPTVSSVSYLVNNNLSKDTLRILIIDDNYSDRELFRQLLLKDDPTAYSISEANLGLNGINLCLSERFDCILLDYFLPDLVGMQFLKYLEDNNQDTPVIMLTGHGNENIAVQALKHGAADYIPKRAVSTESLNRSITNVVEKSRLKTKILRQNNLLEQKNLELTKKHDEIARFYHTVSHELKTPLTSMKEFVNIILDGIAGPISEDQKEYLSLVNESCLQMTNDINDLLDVTRIETGKLKVQFAPVDINELIVKVSQLMQPSVSEKGLIISLQLAKGLPKVLVDHRRIEQVLTNLLTNAIKFTHSGGDISIFSKIDTSCPQYLKISVVDTGCGIHPDNIPKLFNRLYQVESAHNSLGSENSSEAGLGLGLTITKEIIELHHGEVVVHSNMDKGSEFTFTLPLNKPNVVQINR